MAIFSVRGLTKKYGNEVILENVSFSLPSHGLFGFTGESGSGKSTLFRCLLGIDPADSGKIYYQGKEITDFEKFRNQDASVIYQSYNLVSYLNGYQNISLEMQLKGKEEKDRIHALARKLGIDKKLNQKVTTLSGGEKQRIAIARSLSGNPSVLFCDEPTGSLDEENGTRVMEFLKETSKDRLVILITHNMMHLGKYCDGYFQLENHHLRKVYCPEENISSRHDHTRKKHISFAAMVRIAVKTLLRNKAKLVLSLLSLSLSLTFLSLSMNASSSVKESLSSNRLRYMDYNVLRLSKEKVSAIENSNFSLVESSRLSRTDQQYLLPYFAIDEYHYDMTPVFSSYPEIEFPVGSKTYYSTIEMVPYSTGMEPYMKNYLQGYFPGKTVREVLVNDSAAKLLKGNRFGISVSKDIDYVFEDNSVISDSYSFDMTFSIVGRVSEFGLLETPRIYVRMDALEDFAKGIKLKNMSSYYHTEITLYDRLSDYATQKDLFASSTYYLEMENVDEVYSTYQKVNKMKIEETTYSLESTALAKTDSFQTMFDSIEQALRIFVFITLVISVLLLSLCLFSFLQENKKDIGILLSMGMMKTDLLVSFVLQGLLVGTISFALSFFGSSFLSGFINNYCNGQIGMDILSSTLPAGPCFLVFFFVILIAFFSNLASGRAILAFRIGDILKED